MANIQERLQAIEQQFKKNAKIKIYYMDGTVKTTNEAYIIEVLATALFEDTPVSIDKILYSDECSPITQLAISFFNE